MRAFIIIHFVIALAWVGCADGTQKGAFAVSSSESQAIGKNGSTLITLRGTALANNYQPTGPTTPLIYWLIVSSGLQVNGSSSESSNDAYHSVRKESWTVGQNEITFELNWDRRSDRVEVDGMKYDRARGNVFVVVCKDKDNKTSFQIESVQGEPDLPSLIEHIRRKLPDNEAIQKMLE
jgi:hypothetical protein